ncbi:MAG TPA: biotin/lipoyl-containing protein [Thermoanaerobaculia bacterium]|nr:biotin/lipoyl-containing protein [Thermoanaerobaculia bacterium]
MGGAARGVAVELRVRIGERVERVTVEALDEHRYRVRVGERSLEVDARRIGGFDSLIVDGRQFELALTERERRAGASVYLVGDGRESREVEVLEPLAYLAREAGGGGAGAAATVVRAYMPGRVVQVLAPEGATVAAGQGVLVLEAMKMENEIQAEAAGVVAQIFVEPGQAVEGGDPLFEVTPA